MHLHEGLFSPYQIMSHPDFEFYHYFDRLAPVVESHQHDFYEILFFLSGQISYQIQDQTYELEPGDILLINPRDSHCLIAKGNMPYERYVMWVQPSFLMQVDFFGANLSTCFVDALHNQTHLLRPDVSELIQLKSICEKLLHNHNDAEFGSSTLSYAYFLEFLVHLNRVYFSNKPTSIEHDFTNNKKTNEIIGYINMHLTEDLSLERIADTFFLSKSYMSHIFKQNTGLSIYQFIIKKRLMLARNLLYNGASVLDACVGCGFYDYSNFLKAFKREFGCSPKQFIKQK